MTQMTLIRIYTVTRARVRPNTNSASLASLEAFEGAKMPSQNTLDRPLDFLRCGRRDFNRPRDMQSHVLTLAVLSQSLVIASVVR